MAAVMDEETILRLPNEMEKSNGIVLEAADKRNPNVPLHLPGWFFQHCVKISDELNENTHRLIVRDDIFSVPKRPLPGEGELSSETYEIESAMYEKLNNFVSVDESSPIRGWERPGIDGKCVFTNDGAILRFPDDTKGLPFLSAVVERFSKEIDADLITMKFEDFEDLSEHFAEIQSIKKCKDVDCCIKLYFDQDHLSKDKEDKTHSFEDEAEPKLEQETFEWADDTYSFTKKGKKDKKGKKKSIGWVDVEANIEVGVDKVNTGELKNSQEAENESSPTFKEPVFPFSLILHSTSVKRYSEQESSTWPEHHRPLIIHIRGLHKFMEDKIRHSILIQLRGHVQKSLKQGHLLLIATDCNSGSDPYDSSLKDSSILGTLGRNPARRVTRIVPVKSPSQKSLLEKDAGREIERQNIRGLQREIRQRHSFDKTPVLLQPNASWCLEKGSPGLALLRTKILKSDEFEEVVNGIGRKCQISHIEKVLAQVEKNNKALDNWNEISEGGRWLGLPLKAQQAITKIESDRSKYSYEHDMLSLLVNPGKNSSLV